MRRLILTMALLVLAAPSFGQSLYQAEQQRQAQALEQLARQQRLYHQQQQFWQMQQQNRQQQQDFRAWQNGAARLLMPPPQPRRHRTLPLYHPYPAYPFNP